MPASPTDIPVNERATRDELVRTANAYFTGLQQNDGQGLLPLSLTTASASRTAWMCSRTCSTRKPTPAVA